MRRPVEDLDVEDRRQPAQPLRADAERIDLVEQLDAQRNLLTAELSLVQAEADRLTSYVALYQAMGGGWSPAEVSAMRR